MKKLYEPFPNNKKIKILNILLADDDKDDCNFFKRRIS